MARLDRISVETLEEALDDQEQSREVLRLVAAIIYKCGPSVPMIADWLDVRPATIYRWFDRLEAEPLPRAIRDRQRPGRPSKLTDEERSRLTEALQNSPSAVGYDHPEWTPALVRRFVQDCFDVSYTRRHAQRLLNEGDS